MIDEPFHRVTRNVQALRDADERPPQIVQAQFDAAGFRNLFHLLARLDKISGTTSTGKDELAWRIKTPLSKQGYQKIGQRHHVRRAVLRHWHGQRAPLKVDVVPP